MPFSPGNSNPHLWPFESIPPVIFRPLPLAERWAVVALGDAPIFRP